MQRFPSDDLLPDYWTILELKIRLVLDLSPQQSAFECGILLILKAFPFNALKL
jgi:hypothetical protein